MVLIAFYNIRVSLYNIVLSQSNFLKKYTKIEVFNVLKTLRGAQRCLNVERKIIQI